MRKYMRNVASIIGVALLILTVIGGLFALSPITAEAVDPQSPAEWEQGVTPNEVYNDGTGVLYFHWHCWDWVGTGDYYTFAIHELGNYATPIYIQRSDLGDTFVGITVALQDIDGWTAGTDIYNPEETNGGGQTHDWTVPVAFPEGDYWGIVTVYVQAQADPEAQTLISFDILQATGELVVFKYNDLNGNGDWDGGEPGVENFVFDITGPEDHLDQVTNVNGLITLSDIAIGDYTICEETPLPPGWEKTEPAVGYCQPATVTTGGSIQVDFGNQQVGNLEIIKEDEFETGLAGWHFDVTGPESMSGDTGVGGVLLFEDIPVGNYTVTETMEAGWTNIEPPTGPPYTMPAAVPFNDTVTVTFINEETIGDLEIIKRDDTGAGLPGWHFVVTGPVNLSGDTGGGGILLFEDIPVGNYTVTETMKPGWTSIDPGEPGPYTKPAEVFLDTKTTVIFVNERPPSVPTLGQWGMIIMGILFAALVIWLPIRRRRLAANR